MIGVRDVASYVPLASIDNIRQAEQFSESEAFVRRKLGALHLSRKAEDEETSDLANKALLALFERSSLTPTMVEAIVVVTQNGDGEGAPHTAAIVQYKAGLSDSVAAFDISLGCSGYVYALSVLQGFMQASGMQNAVLITADPYSKIVDPDDRVTTLLFGDAATATWLAEGAEWRVAPPLFGTDGSGAMHLEVKDGKFCMNGRQVFNFVSSKISEHIRNYLGERDLVEGDVDVYCLHQGSAAIIDAIARRFPNVRDRFVCDMIGTGNTVSSSIPLLLEKRIHDIFINRILLSGFGVGLSWATTIMEREK